MKYCSHCGAELLDEAVICPKCGCSCKANKVNSINSGEDNPETWMKVLSFFIPVVGLILFLVWMDDKPMSSKACGKWALIGAITLTCIGIAASIIMSLFMLGVFGAVSGGIISGVTSLII